MGHFLLRYSPVLDVYLVGYKDSRYWKPFCYAVIAFSIAALLVMQFFPEESGMFCVRVFNDPGGTFCELLLGIDFKYILCYTYNVI